jgi:hypothetical protein
MPEPPPVISATFPSSFMFLSPLFYCGLTSAIFGKSGIHITKRII